MSAMLATDYADAALAAADQAGINAEALASIGQVESGFRNVPTANGSSSATGPWQVTAPTWQSTVAAHGLGYSTADITNPADQAQVAAYVIKDYASAVSSATNQPATVLQTYGAYLYGPQYGARIAAEADTTPLSAIVPASSLANNGMQNWTVGDFRTTFGAKFGGSANQLVFS
jgi:hypothetical protein